MSLALVLGAGSPGGVGGEFCRQGVPVVVERVSHGDSVGRRWVRLKTMLTKGRELARAGGCWG